MKLQTNYAYYNNLTTNFTKRIRMQNNRTLENPIRSRNNPNLYVYVYEDPTADISIEDRTYDSFTGLKDKNYLLAVLDKKIEESQKSGKSLSIAMFDMDNFKSVNELLGYETGDDFIKTISTTVDNIAKENKLGAYRFGGEEFVVIFEEQSEEEQKKIVDKILNSVNLNRTIKSKEDDYMQNAQGRMTSYSMSSAKIRTLMNLRTKQEIYDDLLENLQTELAKNDPYFVESVKENKKKLYSQYVSLAKERLHSEEDDKIRNMLFSVVTNYENSSELPEEDMSVLDEYLKYCYDKSAESFQIKKWLNDFLNNKGFSITGSAITFNPKFMKNKSPMQLIGVAGEVLKKGKDSRKGKSYYSYR